MIGVIIIVFISWILLRLIDKKNLSVLKLAPTTNRIKVFSIGLLSAASICTIYHIASVTLINNAWKLNDKFTVMLFFTSFWWTLKSVLFEELIFRGVFLYYAIKKIGIKKACCLSATCFGIYHWFSYSAFGDPINMTIIFLMTGFVGFTYALAFAKTESLYLPIGLHLGWNLFNIVVFSNGPLAEQLLLKENVTKPEGFLSLFIFLFQIFALPLFTLWYIRHLSKKQNTYKG